MKLSLSVTEASSANGAITFKIITKVQKNNTIDFTFVSPVYRTHQQLNWLYSRLCISLPDCIIPPLPEPPITNSLDDLDHINRKRVQVERFLQKLGNRTKFVENIDFKYFLTNNMTHNDSLDRKAEKKLGFLNNIIKPNYERGFRIYRPSEPVEENNAEEFQMRIKYVLTLEDQFNGILDNINEMIKQREALGDRFSQTGDYSLQALNSKFRMGDGKSINNIERNKQFDSMLHLFGAITSEVHYLIDRQATLESIIFGDAFLEYRNMLYAIKAIMNNRTEKLVEYVNSVKQRNKKCEKAEKLKLARGLDSHEVQVVIAEESRLTENVQKEKEGFINVQKTVTRELIRFEKEKSKDFNRVLKEYSELQLRFEKQKLKALTTYLDKLKNISIEGKIKEVEQDEFDNTAEFHGITVAMTRIKPNLQQQNQLKLKQTLQQQNNNSVQLNEQYEQYDKKDFNIDQKNSPKIFQQYDPLNVAHV